MAQLPCIGLSWLLTNRHLLGVASHLLSLWGNPSLPNFETYLRVVCKTISISGMRSDEMSLGDEAATLGGLLELSNLWRELDSIRTPMDLDFIYRCAYLHIHIYALNRQCPYGYTCLHESPSSF